MEEEEKKQKPGWLIFLYLLPIYILIAYLLAKWVQKVNSPDLILPKDDYSVLAEDIPIQQSEKEDKYLPRLPDTGLTVKINYGRKGDREVAGIEQGKQTSPAKKSSQQAGGPVPQTQHEKQAVQSQQPVSEEKAKELKSVGFIRGYLTLAVDKLMDNPKAVQAMLNNPLVVKGFMERATVMSVLNDSKALENFLTRTNAINNFLGNSMVQKALNNPEVVNIVAQSKLMNEILTSPAISGLLKNPESADSIIQSNPQLATLLSNPNIMNALMNNPQTAGAWTQLNMQGKLPGNPQ